MQASETKLQKIIEGTQQYVVPLFQRPYSWKKSEWEALWSDLVELYDLDNPRSHFLGSIVTMLTNTAPEGVSKYLLIDGQQRLTTILILLSALRDSVKQSEDNLALEINNKFLVNPYEDKSGYYKLRPTQIDRVAFSQIINSESSINDSLISECYSFFKKKIRQKKSSLEPARLKNIICSNLSIVNIVLSEDDNPHLVFESINGKGRDLTQADLIRNYFFMRIEENDQDSLHTDYWEPMQESLGDDLTEFIRHYLTKTGIVVNQRDIYFKVKEQIDNNGAILCLKDLHTFSKYYSRLLYPDREPKETIRKYLYRLKRLKVSTVYPFLLNCYDDWMREKITEQDFISVFKILENYILRRFVCNIQTRGLNKIFASLYSQIAKENDITSGNFIERLRLVLQNRYYPKDEDFRARLIDIDLFGDSRSEKCKIILESIEESFDHNEQVIFDSLFIEHIMPQSLNNEWTRHLGEDWETTHKRLQNTLGNLTLMTYPFELSNVDFEVKKTHFASSSLKLNEYFKSKESWTRRDIEERANYLADIALQIWSYFGDETT